MRSLQSIVAMNNAAQALFDNAQAIKNARLSNPTMILNVGSRKIGGSDTNEKLLRVCLDELIGRHEYSIRFVDRGSEEGCFVVAIAEGNWVPVEAVYHLSGLLEQDCIAYYLPGLDEGFLQGPGAKAWGAFNPEMFVQ